MLQWISSLFAPWFSSNRAGENSKTWPLISWRLISPLVLCDDNDRWCKQVTGRSCLFQQHPMPSSVLVLPSKACFIQTADVCGSTGNVLCRSAQKGGTWEWDATWAIDEALSQCLLDLLACQMIRCDLVTEECMGPFRKKRRFWIQVSSSVS